MKDKLYPLIILIFCVGSGVILKDYFGIFILSCGLLNVYYASKGSIYNYLFGALFCLLNSYVSFRNGLYGIVILSLIVYLPLQIKGFISWQKNMTNNEVNLKVLNRKKSLITILCCTSGSLLFAFLLSIIPKENLAFLDASSNMLNLGALILLTLRYKECWIVWIVCNVIDLLIWTINYINNTPNSKVMLLVSISYMVMNIWGLIKWQEKENKVWQQIRSK